MDQMNAIDQTKSNGGSIYANILKSNKEICVLI